MDEEDVLSNIHACCGECWFTRFRQKAELGPPVRDRSAGEATCCYCGRKTVAGIFVREKPEFAPCRGRGAEHS